MEYLFMIVVFVLMIVMMIVPQKKRDKQMRELRNNLEVGDVVITECGITGRVISVKDPETVTIETGADKTRLKFKRWAVISKETQE